MAQLNVLARWLHITRLVAAGGLSALALVAIPADAVAGKNGTARYKYKVSDAQYSATGVVTAYIDPTDCGSSDLSWAAGVTTKLSDGFLPSLGGSIGNASIRIGRNGSVGKIDVRVPVQSSLDGQITDTVCTDEGSYFEFTPCKEGPVDGDIEVSGVIDASVGTKVTVYWKFFVVASPGSLLPDDFVCHGALVFPQVECESQARLSQFTKKTVTLPFTCPSAYLYSPPPGSGADDYAAGAEAEGSFTLKRTKQN